MIASAEKYDHRSYVAQRGREATRAAQDIGEIPPVENAERRSEAAGSFRRFCEHYFAEKFYLAWSADHLKIIDRIEISVRTGGLFAVAMPRGSGKSSLCEAACLWAILTGFHQFVLLIGSDEQAAIQMLDSIKTALECNDLLAGDFPEACHPFQRLEGSARRCEGQRYKGERTHIGWTEREIVFPTIPDSKASGAIFRVAGITGRIRGHKFTRPDGTTVRPTLVIPDDPQTDASAKSPTQCQQREQVVAGAVLGLAGPGKKISGIMPLTVIRPGDMADNVLDRRKHPEWNGERTKLLYAMPSNEKLWETYAEIRGESLRKWGDIRDATDFYRLNCAEMDAGAVVAWPERKNHDELSAIQHAMNLKLQDERAFAAEYQNDPLPEVLPDADDLTADFIAGKLSGFQRGLVPVSCGLLTAYVDVQSKLLYYAVAAWSSDFTGYLVDYGAFPDQSRDYFTLSDAKSTLGRRFPGMGQEGQWHAGLSALTDFLLGRDWALDGGGSLRIGGCLIDANYGTSTDTIYGFIRTSQYAALLRPSHGHGIGASGRPMIEWDKKPGDQLGLNWRYVKGKRPIRHVIYDTNFWKSFIAKRLKTAIGDKGSLSLFGTKPERHRCFAEHCMSEYRVPVEGRGRKVDEWKQLATHADNHWWDCLVGCAVGASMQGASLSEASPVAAPARMSLSELARRRGK